MQLIIYSTTSLGTFGTALYSVGDFLRDLDEAPDVPDSNNDVG